MATILLHPLPDFGHIRPLMTLAKHLRDKGHRVVYLVEVEIQEAIENEGFAFMPYLEAQYPKGSIEERADLPPQEIYEWFRRKDAHMWEECASGRLAKQLASQNPDIIIGDVCRPETSVAAHKLGIPFIRLSASLPTGWDPVIPPTYSDALPGEMSPLRLEQEWLCHTALMHRELWVDKENPIRRTEFYRVLTEAGIHLAQYNERGAWAWYIEGDAELVLCSEALDFDRIERRERVYAGPCLGHDDEAETWTYPGRRANSPLVYCSFGSQPDRYPRLQQFVNDLLQVARSRPHVDFALGALLDEDFDPSKIPENVYSMKWAPQRAVLKQADVFITHGGLGSMKEAVWEAVPLIAYPQAYDQRGNAARVEYLGLGKRFKGTGCPSPEEIGDAIDATVGDVGFREVASKLQARLRADAEKTTGVDFIEAMIAGKVELATFEHFKSMTRQVFVNLAGTESS